LNDVDVVEQELNEVSWWSHWGELAWLDKGAYTITSRVFSEPLFNHASLLKQEVDPGTFVDRAVAAFSSVGIPPSFFLIDSPAFYPLRERLAVRGFSETDTMHVLAAADLRMKAEEDIDLVVVRSDVHAWVNAYLQSFYGDEALGSPAGAAVSRAVRDEAVSLVLAKRRETVVGEMALYRRDGLLGAYCVGTLPAHRKTGVASLMLGYALSTAKGQGLTLVLQTFASDGVEGFYLKRGFKRIYQKQVLTRG